jgi:hypothetical protein
MRFCRSGIRQNTDSDPSHTTVSLVPSVVEQLHLRLAPDQICRGVFDDARDVGLEFDSRTNHAASLTVRIVSPFLTELQIRKVLGANKRDELLSVQVRVVVLVLRVRALEFRMFRKGWLIRLGSVSESREADDEVALIQMLAK